MLYYLNGSPAAPSAPPDDSARVICLAAPDEALPAGLLPTAGPAGLPAQNHGAASRFESRDGYDFIFLNIPNLINRQAPDVMMEVYFTSGRLVVIHQPVPAVERLRRDMESRREEIPPERALYLLFAHLTEGDAAALDDIEEEIAALEDEVSDSGTRMPTARISALRRHLLALKRYYEALFDLLEDLEENANAFISKPQLRSFRIQTNRADRLNRAVLNLRDYVTQVREAYQNQLDISLNQTMKLFTVITTVFLPLTLLTGWYGMNLAMPEYAWPYAYPVVIGASVLVVAGCLLFFKLNKWF